VLGSIIGILGFTALALAYLRGSYNKATIEALRGDLGDYKNREQLHDSELADCRRRITTLEEAVNSRDHVIEVLREETTQRAAVADLAAQSATQHTEMMRAIGQLTSAVKGMKTS
jgi:hypothetical protein